jgi:hypothetical protein
MNQTIDQTVFYRKLLRRARSFPAEVASRLIDIPPLAHKLASSYERQVAQHKPSLPQLPDLDAQIVAGLERNGVHITSLAALALPDTDKMLPSAQQLMEVYAARSARGEFRNRYTTQADDGELMQHPQIFWWGLNQRLLRIVEAYLGLPVGYDGLNFFYTVADGRQVGARRWHRDLEDRRIVKVTVYLHDVGEDDGPYEILHRDFPGSQSLLDFNYPVLTQEELEQKLGAAISDDDVTSCTGPAGTVIFSDPASYYHRGKPAVSRDRCAIFYNYMSRVPLRPFFCERSGLSRAQIALLAGDLPPDQRACALWRDELPWIARIIPPAPI